MKQAVITVGLGFGDEGKGATVDYLCRLLKARLVVRYCGGSQCGHNVELPDGRRHTFSQFGAGTLAGANTYLGQQVIINPPAMEQEAQHLKDVMGISNPYRMLTIHPRCLVSTIYHQRANQAKEYARGKSRHGSCGHGIGETRNYWLQYGEDAIFAEDLRHIHRLTEKLELLKQRKLIEFASAFESSGNLYDRLTKTARQSIDILSLSSRSIAKLLSSLSYIDREYTLNSDIPYTSTAIFEGAQGVLLDEWYGFHPYTTWSTVTPHFAIEMADHAGSEEFCVLGIIRTYMTRHGAGPLPTFDADLTARLTDPGNPENEWQGKLRCGGLDLVLLKYAIAACGGIDGLAVNHLDQVDGLFLCDAYAMMRDEEVFTNPSPNVSLSSRVQMMLEDVEPMGWHATADGLRQVLSQIAPIIVEGSGPTHEQRKSTELVFRSW